MARRAPDSRFEDLAGAAARVFGRSGYSKTQMSDIAREMGVSAGTLYLYVESKEALLEMALRHSIGRLHLPPDRVPIPRPEAGATLRLLEEGLEETAVWSRLEKAMASARSGGAIETEVVGLLEELYDRMWQFRAALLLLTRCSRDWPEFADIFFGGFRRSLIDSVQRYLELRVEAGQLRPLPDSHLAAVFVVESLAWWAIERPEDPDYQDLDDSSCRRMVIDQLLSSLLPTTRNHS